MNQVGAYRSGTISKDFYVELLLSSSLVVHFLLIQFYETKLTSLELIIKKKKIGIALNYVGAYRSGTISKDFCVELLLSSNMVVHLFTYSIL